MISCLSPPWTADLVPTHTSYCYALTSRTDGRLFGLIQLTESAREALEGDWAPLLECLGPQAAVPYRAEERRSVPLQLLRACEPYLPSYWLTVPPPREELRDLNQYLGLEGEEALWTCQRVVCRRAVLPHELPRSESVPDNLRARVMATPLMLVCSRLRTACAHCRDPLSPPHTCRQEVQEICLSGSGLTITIRNQPGLWLRRLLRLAVGEELRWEHPALLCTCYEHGDRDDRYLVVYQPTPDQTLTATLLWE